MAAFLQRFPECKTVFFGTIAQRTVPGTKILCSGFWGSARHLNYLGEIVQVRARVRVGLRHSNAPPHVRRRAAVRLREESNAPRVQGVALALPGVLANSSGLPLLYPLYYVALFTSRQSDDDRICAAKYGSKWDEYCRIAPYKICPFVY